MEYTYKTYTEVFKENACEHIEGGEKKLENLMITYWVPLNFEADTYNFLLRNNHEATKPMTEKRYNEIEKLWLEKLGFGANYGFEETDSFTKNNELVITNKVVRIDLGSNKEIDTDSLITKHDEEDTEVESI